MASSLIHMAIASELNKKLNKDNKSILIGSIAPDISRQINNTKRLSHFITDNTEIPDLNKFLSIYKPYLNDDFVLGYYIHLYTDYIWEKYFITDYIKDNGIYDINNNLIHLTSNEIIKYIYNDYTNLNMQVINNYKLDINVLKSNHPTFNNIIKEIPMNKLNIIINKTIEIINNSKENKAYLFDITNISKFINFCINALLDDLKNLGIYKV